MNFADWIFLLGAHLMSSSLPVNVLVQEVLNVCSLFRVSREFVNAFKSLSSLGPSHEWSLPVNLTFEEVSKVFKGESSIAIGINSANHRKDFSF